jgi:hypothetical protein
MKKSNLILLSALGALLFFSLAFQLSVHSYVRKADANKVPTKTVVENREVSSFNGISVNSRIKVLFKQTDVPSLTVEAPDHLIDSISTSVLNEKLVIEIIKKMNRKDSITIRVNNPELVLLKLGSEAHFKTVGKISGEELNLMFTDESSADMELSYDFLKHENTSTGIVNIKGKINHVEFSNKNKEE